MVLSYVMETADPLRMELRNLDDVCDSERHLLSNYYFTIVITNSNGI